MRLSFTWIPLLLQLTNAKVIEATDKDINEYMSNGIPTILDIYASWCGHCKTFAPVFDELAALYESEAAKKKIQFVKIDGDKNRKVTKQYKVEYFPTIKYVEADGTSEMINARDIESLKALILSKAGVQAGNAVPETEDNLAVKTAAVAGEVVELDDSTFEDGVEGKNALVAFTTSWCGHCKNMKAEWQKTAELYAGDEDILIANVDCTEKEHAEQLISTFGVKGFPTIIYFPADGSTPVPYQSGRSLKDFVDFFQETGASYREVDGTLGEKAGVIESLAVLAQDLVQGSAEKLADFEAAAAAFAGKKNAELYIKYAKRVSEVGVGYATKEISRLRSLQKSHIAKDKSDSIQTRINILRTFEKAKAAVEDVKAEL